MAASLSVVVIDSIDAGFGKEHLKVQVEPSGSLKVSGERAVDGGGGRQWCHFTKRFDLPASCDCDAAEIKVQLDKGMLYVQVPGDGGGAGGSGEQDSAAEMCEDPLQGQGEAEIGGGAAGGAAPGAAARRGPQRAPAGGPERRAHRRSLLARRLRQEAARRRPSQERLRRGIKNRVSVQ